MDYLFQDGGKPKKTKSKTKTGTKTKSKTGSKTKSSSKTSTKTTKSKTGTKKTGTKKGGNFLGTVGDLVAPTGWGPFATAAGLLALDRADAALRRGKSEKSSAKKGGMRGGNKYDDEARIIIDDDKDLHKMFKTLYKDAYSLAETSNIEAHCQGIDEYIDKENENRKNLIKGMTDEGLKNQIHQSITKLEEIKVIGTRGPRVFSNYNSLPTSQQEIMRYYDIFKRKYLKPKYTNS